MPPSSQLDAPVSAMPDRSTAGILVDTLRTEIIQGKLQPGERLKQDAIASRFGVSQTVAREAFKDLIGECFLVAEPRRGVSVARMSAEEAEETTALRILVEGQALAWAIPLMTDAHLDTAQRLSKELDRAKDVGQRILLNAQFHRTLYAACGRARTIALVETLRLGFERYLRFTWEATSHVEQSQHEHRELLALCRQRNVDAACDLLRAHIAGTGKLLIERLQADA
ncbi:GntR family transcriptional regulator [Cupriavidus plantarum]|uniref:GntR family transcriptional regulator n=1 Tax=Cupriavidus plantarum TaxID=942865 RepID=A0A316F8W9_9BURK|nr:GntR family transcriptional regulator [Cupriavidus plantarum]PWK33535.1 GntR family transcriptional regulator [Cupriavidus plantarum]REE87554.1 GntR family transcriptional regulator [Cupriavidus plantarum]